MRAPGLSAFLVDPRELLPQFPAITVNDDTAARIMAGRNVHLPEFSGAPLVRVFAFEEDCLIAICERIAGPLFHPRVVLGRTSPGSREIRTARNTCRR